MSRLSKFPGAATEVLDLSPREAGTILEEGVVVVEGEVHGAAALVEVAAVEAAEATAVEAAEVTGVTAVEVEVAGTEAMVVEVEVVVVGMGATAAEEVAVTVVGAALLVVGETVNNPAVGAVGAGVLVAAAGVLAVEAGVLAAAVGLLVAAVAAAAAAEVVRLGVVGEAASVAGEGPRPRVVIGSRRCFPAVTFEESWRCGGKPLSPVRSSYCKVFVQFCLCQ